MKPSVIDVHDMLSVLSVDEVERRICDGPGVGSATVNHPAGNAAVRYDETRREIADIKSAVRQRGYESKAAVAKLRERQIEVVMLTGDNAATAKRIAADLGIDSVLASR